MTSVTKEFSLKSLPPIERNADGSLPRMTPKQRKEAVGLIRRLCSNYFCGNCLPLDHGEAVSCFQCASHSVCCKFFRHVLLEDPAGQALKAGIFEGEAQGSTKKCAICGSSFKAVGNRTKYCARCGKKVRREQQADWARGKRAANIPHVDNKSL